MPDDITTNDEPDSTGVCDVCGGPLYEFTSNVELQQRCRDFIDCVWRERHRLRFVNGELLNVPPDEWQPNRRPPALITSYVNHLLHV
jgi:hypothetical protein